VADVPAGLNRACTLQQWPDQLYALGGQRLESSATRAGAIDVGWAEEVSRGSRPIRACGVAEDGRDPILSEHPAELLIGIPLEGEGLVANCQDVVHVDDLERPATSASDDTRAAIASRDEAAEWRELKVGIGGNGRPLLECELPAGTGARCTDRGSPGKSRGSSSKIVDEVRPTHNVATDLPAGNHTVRRDNKEIGVTGGKYSADIALGK
jgi:hypothetical protein